MNIEPIVDLYARILQQVEDHLKGEYRVTEIRAYTLTAEYPPPNTAYGATNPQAFPLGRIDMSFRVTALKLPVKYNPDEAEITVELIQNALVIRKVVYTQQLPNGGEAYLCYGNG